MSDEAALLRAIHAHPDDDTPRLVFADWLDEHGQPERAEFIRAQIEYERTSDNALGARSHEMLLKHRDEWTAHFGPRESERVHFGFHRGFPESVSFSGANPSDYSVLSRFPEVRRINIEMGKLSLGGVRAIGGLKR